MQIYVKILTKSCHWEEAEKSQDIIAFTLNGQTIYKGLHIIGKYWTCYDPVIKNLDCWGSLAIFEQWHLQSLKNYGSNST